MKPEYTDEQISGNYELWEQYADPHGEMNREQFDALDIDTKISMLIEMFPDEPHKPHAAGTAPDTSLWLGNTRRAWLKGHGGIQPTIHAMIDRAMKRNP